MSSRSNFPRHFAGLLLTLALTAGPAAAQDEQSIPEGEAGGDALPLPFSETMTIDRLVEIILLIDPEATRQNNSASFTVDGVPVTMVSDPAADRMRLVIGIVEVKDVTDALLMRVMQANFDAALDARYAIAQDVLWATYIHPLSSLGEQEFLSGLAQTVNLVKTFGTTFSSGLFTFGGGDSGGIYEDLLERLERQKDTPT